MFTINNIPYKQIPFDHTRFFDTRVVITNHDRIVKPISDKGGEIFPLIVQECGSPYVEQFTLEGVNSTDKLQMYVETKYNLYKYFEPSLYQSCLVKIKGYWTVAVCSQVDPLQFYGVTDYESCIPLNRKTKDLIGTNLTYKDYLQHKLEIKH